MRRNFGHAHFFAPGKGLFYGAPFVSKFFLKDFGSGTNQMGGFVGGAQVLQMADSWTWWIS